MSERDSERIQAAARAPEQVDAQEHEPAGPVLRGRGPLAATSLVALQRGAGNAAVGRLLARQVPAPTPAPAAVSAGPAARARAAAEAASRSADAAERPVATTLAGSITRRVASDRAASARRAAREAANMAARAAQLRGRAAEQAANRAVAAAARAAADARVSAAAPAAGALRVAPRSPAEVEALINEVLRAISWHETRCRDMQSAMRTTSRQPASFRSRVQATPVWAVDALLDWARGAPRGDVAEATRRRQALTERGLSVALLEQAKRIVGHVRWEGNNLNLSLEQRRRGGHHDSVAWVWVQVRATAEAVTAQQFWTQHRPRLEALLFTLRDIEQMFVFRNLRRAWQQAMDSPFRLARLQALTDAEVMALAEPAERIAAVPVGAARRRRDPGADPAQVNLADLRRQISRRPSDSVRRQILRMFAPPTAAAAGAVDLRQRALQKLAGMALGGADETEQQRRLAARQADAATLGMTYNNAIEAYTRGRGSWNEDLAGWQRAMLRRVMPVAAPGEAANLPTNLGERIERAAEEALPSGGAGLWLGRERFASSIRALLRGNPLQSDAEILRSVAGSHNPGNRDVYSRAVVDGALEIRVEPRHDARQRQRIPGDPPIAAPPAPAGRPRPIPAQGRPPRPRPRPGRRPNLPPVTLPPQGSLARPEEEEEALAAAEAEGEPTEPVSS